MADADFWRAQAESFKSITREFEVRLQVNWKKIQGVSITWELPGTGGISNFPAFEANAARAGKAIDPTASDLVGAWMNALVEYSHRRKQNLIQGVEVTEDGTELPFIGGVIANACWTSVDYCHVLEVKALQEPPALQELQSVTRPTDPSRKDLRDQYFRMFPEKIIILDLCWAAKERYREWKRWIAGKVKDGSKPDRAFRGILTSGKRPSEYRAEIRPINWQ
jgi:hypothetical protein